MQETRCNMLKWSNILNQDGVKVDGTVHCCRVVSHERRRYELDVQKTDHLALGMEALS